MILIYNAMFLQTFVFLLARSSRIWKYKQKNIISLENTQNPNENENSPISLIIMIKYYIFCIEMNVVSFDLDENGLMVSDLEDYLKTFRGKALSERFPYKGVLYTIPNYHNPTGISLAKGM